MFTKATAPQPKPPRPTNKMSVITDFSSWAYQGKPPDFIGKLIWLLFLLPVSLLYGLGLKIHRIFLKKPQKLDIPVISVGSITVGGAGKSPITAFLAQKLLDKGYKVAILSRGYKRQSQKLTVVADGRQILVNDYRESGDEPLMLARQLGGRAVVITYHDRYVAGLKATEMGCQVAILDDGAQHMKLQRDLDIIVLNPERPLGNGALLPAGPLRDLPSRIKKADLIWYHGNSDKSPTGQSLMANRAGYVQSSCHLNDLHITGQKIAVFCGLARPENFLNSLRELNPAEIVPILFPDHHAYSDGDLLEIIHRARKIGCRYAVTTEKDLAKINGATWPDGLPLLAAKLELQVIDNNSILEKKLEELLHG